MGKEEIARYEQFLPFPQCFQKLSVVDALKMKIYGVKGLNKKKKKKKKKQLV